MACSSRSAITPRKFSFLTTRTNPATPLTDRSSKLTRLLPIFGGRITRPWSIDGTRTLCTYGNEPVTLAGTSTRGTDLPTRRDSLDPLRRTPLEATGRASPASVFCSSWVLKLRPPINSAYEICFEETLRTRTITSTTSSWSTVTLNESASIYNQERHSYAAAIRKG